MRKHLNDRNKGITLVALVITIILLLILAGITINLLKETGIFEKVQLAKQRTEEEQEKENAILNKYQETLTKEINGNRNDKTVEDYTTNLIYKLNFNNLDNQEGVTVNGTGITVSDDKKYATFDGNSYINVNNDTIDPDNIYRNESDATLCCWYRTTNSGHHVMLKYGEDGYSRVHNVHYFSCQGTIGAGQGYATCIKFIDPSNCYDGNWHFIVGIWKDNNTVQFYYDGVPFINSGSYAQTNSYLDIGGNRDGYYFTGDLSDIRVYRGTLTENQVKQLYKYGKNYLGID